jgi:carbon monoxide dehydrogenase subunit G
VSVVTADIHIKAPIEEVWRTIMDPQRFGDWVTIHRRMHHADSGPPREGMKMEQTLCIRGANFKVKWQLATCDTPHKAEWHGKGPMGSNAATIYELSENDGGTDFHYVNEFKAPGGPLGAVASRVLVGGVPEREAHASLERLRALLEN